MNSWYDDITGDGKSIRWDRMGKSWPLGRVFEDCLALLVVRVLVCCLPLGNPLSQQAGKHSTTWFPSGCLSLSIHGFSGTRPVVTMDGNIWDSEQKNSFSSLSCFALASLSHTASESKHGSYYKYLTNGNLFLRRCKLGVLNLLNAAII